MTKISCNTETASIKKCEESSLNRIEINYETPFYHCFTTGWSFMPLFYTLLSLGVKQCDINSQPVVKHVNVGFRYLFLNYFTTAKQIIFAFKGQISNKDFFFEF